MPVQRPVLGRWLGIIDQILIDDPSQPKKATAYSKIDLGLYTGSLGGYFDMDKNRFCIWVSVFFLLPALALQAQQSNSVTTAPLSQQTAGPAVPRLIYFNGVVMDLAGKSQTGVASITFSLYEEQEGGNPLWAEIQNLQLDEQGRYTVLLGAMQPTGLPLDLFTTGKARWLGVRPEIAGVGELPRILLVGVPYALKAADADTLGGMPASAFVQASVVGPAPGGSPGAVSGVSQEAARAIAPNTACSGLTSDGTATPNQIAKFTTTCNVEPSLAIFESGGKVGIGTTAPAVTLDVKGTAFVRGVLELPAKGLATSAGGFSSQPLDLLGSAYSTGTNAAKSQHFRWQAEPLGNNTATPSGTMNLLYGAGSAPPTETGFSIASNGIVTFAPGQTIPPVTGDFTAAQFTSTAPTGTPPFILKSTTQVPNLNASLLGGLPANSFASVVAPNTFAGNQSFLGNVGIGTTSPAGGLDVITGATCQIYN